MDVELFLVVLGLVTGGAVIGALTWEGIWGLAAATWAERAFSAPRLFAEVGWNDAVDGHYVVLDEDTDELYIGGQLVEANASEPAAIEAERVRPGVAWRDLVIRARRGRAAAATSRFIEEMEDSYAALVKRYDDLYGSPVAG